MKTKIIYISGNEVFDIADIRAAFEEVRTALGLGKDTVMFGVPVDSDDASIMGKSSAEQSIVSEVVTEDVITTDNFAANDIAAVAETTVKDMEQTDAATTDTEQIAEKNIKKTTSRKARTRTKEKINTETIAETEPTTVADADNSEKIIPILSILASQKDESDADSEPELVEKDEPNSDNETPSEEPIEDIEISAELDVSEETIGTDANSTTIADMITDDAPEAPVEKTLEQLLESMTPLREDIIEEPAEENILPDEDTNADTSINVSEEDTDATLEQLAAEFAENQDKIPTQPKVENHSKIGKLKNILPFKKAKRDDSGLMGDLFGWAGIAANDDDFSIPGFFTTAASKK